MWRKLRHSSRLRLGSGHPFHYTPPHHVSLHSVPFLAIPFRSASNLLRRGTAKCVRVDNLSDRMPSTNESAHALTRGCADPGARPAMGVHSKGVADSPCSRLRPRGKAHRGRGRTGQMPPKLTSPSVWPLATYAQRVGVPIAVALALDAKLAEFPIHYATCGILDPLLELLGVALACWRASSYRWGAARRSYVHQGCHSNLLQHPPLFDIPTHSNINPPQQF